MKFLIALLACLAIFNPLSETQGQTSKPTPEEFRRFHNHVLSTGNAEFIPGPLAQRIGLVSSPNKLATKRKAWTERKPDTNALVRVYIADVPNVTGSDRLLFICQEIVGDTIICWLFNDGGNIVRVVEIFKSENWRMEDILTGAYDSLGYVSFKLILSKVPG